VNVLIRHKAAAITSKTTRYAIIVHFVRSFFSEQSNERTGNIKLDRLMQCVDMLINEEFAIDNPTDVTSGILQINMGDGQIESYVISEVESLSPLKMAVEKKCLPLILYLLRKGADIDKKYGGASARDIVKKRDTLSVWCSLFKKRSSKVKKNILDKAQEIMCQEDEEAWLLKEKQKNLEEKMLIESKRLLLHVAKIFPDQLSALLYAKGYRSRSLE
jgi:hypothetical protein